MRWLRIICALFLTVYVGACESTIEPHQEHTTPKGHVSLVVTDITAADPAWERLTRIYRRSLVQELGNSNAFLNVIWPKPSELQGKSIFLSGVVLSVEEGSEPERFFVGYGVGDPSLQARIMITDDAGQTLIEFDQSTSYAQQGSGSHFNPVTMVDEMQAFADTTAEAIIRWRRGEALEETFLW